MTCISAIGIYNNLPSGQAAVSLRSANYKTSSGVDEEFGFLIYHICRQHLIENVFFHICVNLLLCNALIVLGGKNHCIQADRVSFLVVLYRNLGLSIRTKIRQGSVFAHLGQLTNQLVSQSDRIRHILLRLIGSIAEHHTLVACTNSIQLAVVHRIFSCFQSLIYTHGNIAGLLVQSNQNAAGITVKTVFCTVVTDFTNGLTNDRLNIYICIGRNLSHNHNQTGSGAGFACNAAHGVLFHQRIQNGIGNGITHFIRMSLSYRFRSKQYFLHHILLQYTFKTKEKSVAILLRT